jgi:hypothetical protein
MPEAVRLGLCETTSNCGTGNGLPVGADRTTQRKQGKCFRTADECGDEADHHQNRTRLGRTTVQPSCREEPYGPPSGLSHRGPSCVRRSFRARLSSQSPQAPGKPLHGSHPAQWRLCSRVRQWRASFAPTQLSSHQAPWAARCAVRVSIATVFLSQLLRLGELVVVIGQLILMSMSASPCPSDPGRVRGGAQRARRSLDIG